MNPPEFHVLLIEDSPSDARLLCDLLASTKTAQFHVDCAGRLATAWQPDASTSPVATSTSYCSILVCPTAKA